jgi:toxin ParE1/3/4
LKKYEVRFLAEAVDDLDAIFVFIAQNSSFEIADGYLARIERVCRSLQTFPLRGTTVPGRIQGLRTMGFERRITIVFKVAERSVSILRILYGGRNLGPQPEK